jgi:N-acetylmuramoyl-L-alanine amidase CwlA
MCINADGDYDTAFSNTIALTKYLMSELEIDKDHVVRHYDASRKDCPMSMDKNNWAKWTEFKKRLSEEEDEDMAKIEELQTQISEMKASYDNIINTMGQEIAELKNPMIYNYIDSNMPDWAKEAVQSAVDKGIVQGDDNGLGLTYSDLRTIVREHRAGMY